MSKLIVKTSMSLDGFIGGPNGELDWLFKNSDKGGIQWIHNVISNASLHIMGSRTFYDMKAYWPYSNDLLAAPMNDIPKMVFTQKGLDPEGGASTQAIKDATAADKAKGVSLNETSDQLGSWLHPKVSVYDIATEITRLKEQPGKPIVAHGGADFLRSLIKTGLVDEYHLAIFPVILGKGLPIFSEALNPIDLQLKSVEQFEKGVVAHVYEAKV